MIAYRDMCNLLEGSFDGCEVNHIAHASNEEANALANIRSTRAPIPDGVFMEEIQEKFIKLKPPALTQQSTTHSRAAPETSTMIEEQDELDVPIQVLLIDPIWTNQYLAYIMRHKFSYDPSEARHIIRRSTTLQVINGEFTNEVSLVSCKRYIAPEDGKNILLDIHEGICDHHASSRALEKL
jgi:hypothetical protein